MMQQQLHMVPLSTTPDHLRRASDVSNDPFSRAMQPPSNETVVQRQARLKDEIVARKRSDQIDKQLKEEATRAKRERAYERTILLLGE